MDELNEKLIAKKEEWAKAKRGLSLEEGAVQDHRPRVNRLPPGQHLTKGWPVLDLGIHPTIPLTEWRLSVGGLVDHPFIWTGKISSRNRNCTTCRTSIA
jgi:Sulfite oxidase and related enzymes